MIILGGLLLLAAGPAYAVVSRFARVSIPAPSPATLGPLSCSSSSWCFALGQYPNRSRSSSLILAERWDGESWKQVHAPTPSNATPLGISCASSRSCVMVGVRSGPTNTPFAERWRGRAWHVMHTPKLLGSDNFVNGVSCPSASACVAVGTTEAQTPAQAALVERWDGRSWTDQRVPGSKKGVLNSVSCTAPGDCWAVGFIASSHAALIVHVGASDEGVVHSPAGAGMLASVSCPAASSCWAVGNARAPSLIGLQSGAWQTFPSTNRYGQILSISCIAATDCWAAGVGAGAPWAGRWDGSTWTSAQTSGISEGTFSAIACPGSTVCYAVGFTGHGLGQALVARSQNP